MSVRDPGGGEGREGQRYETIIIVGGGCYGGYYVRQLHRAARAGALTASAIQVVDRDARCAVALTLEKEGTPPIPTTVVVAEWRAFFGTYLDRAAAEPHRAAHDAIVPSPLMPHLMAEWVVRRAKTRWPRREIATVPLRDAVPVPWQRAGEDGTHYVSFAEWICPINCIEPRVCPATKAERDWSMPPTVAAYASAAGIGSAVMFCRHRTFGVGMFDTAEVIAADNVVRETGERGGGDIVLGTTSHCHGALTRLCIGPEHERSDSHVR